MSNYEFLTLLVLACVYGGVIGLLVAAVAYR